MTNPGEIPRNQRILTRLRLAMNSILIVVDNLDLGGVQRLALDEAYYLTSQGAGCAIVSLSPIKNSLSITSADGDFFLQNPVEILEAPLGRFSQLKFFQKLLKRMHPNIVICHAARSLLYLRFLRYLVGPRSFKIRGFIHQMPQMSSRLQSLKRAIYFRFADEVSAVSNQFRLELNYLRSKTMFYRIFYRNDVKFDRVGVFLPRLDFLSNQAKEQLCQWSPLIYLGRITKWKGYEKFCELVNKYFKEDEVIVFTSPALHANIFHEEFFSSPKRKIIYSQGIASFRWQSTGIHIYPTYYGENTKYPMSISFNVLECIYLGIPSLISNEGFESWPEFRGSNLCQTTTWEPGEVLALIERIRSLSVATFQKEARTLREVISIRNHCDKILSMGKTESD